MMHPVPVKLVMQGNSTAFIIPVKVAYLFGYTPGMIVRVKLTKDGPTFDRPLIPMSNGRSVGMVVPKAILDMHHLKRGDVIKVPFHKWDPPSGKKSRPLDKKKPPARKRKGQKTER